MTATVSPMPMNWRALLIHWTATAPRRIFDGDNSPDCVDEDDDNDGTNDDEDAFPFDPTETSDNDNDGIGDNADPDDDKRPVFGRT